MHSSDTLSRFIFDKGAVRGEIVHLDATWEAVLARHEYPPILRARMGEFMAASALLAATLKFNGSLTMQVQAEGPVNLLVVECSSERVMRATAQWSDLPEQASLPELFGNGQLVITLDPEHGKERYQGIVKLEGHSVAEILQNYLQQSEQLNTSLWLAADDSRATGMLLQKLPDRESDDEDIWQRALHLGATVSQQELLQLDAQEIIQRLFHQEDIRLFDPEPVRFGCSCSRERVANVLKMLGHDEITAILHEEGAIHVNCEFCNQFYEFDSVDAEQLFASDSMEQASHTLH